MLKVSITAEPIDSAGALALLYAATDELNQRYGLIDDDARLSLGELRPPKGIFLVARDNRDLCGGVGLREIASPELQLAEVKRLWVRPDLRRHGVAAQLMSHVETHARRLGYRQLYLETGPRQPEAIAFYPKHSWTQIGEFPPDVFSHETAVRFTKVL